MNTPAANGQLRKRAAFGLLEETRESAITLARRRFLSHLLAHGRGTTDQARDGSNFPLGARPVYLGAVPGALARANVIRRVGYVSSVRPEAKARVLAIWELVDPPKARAWLLAHPEATPSGAQLAFPFKETEKPGRGNAPAN